MIFLYLKNIEKKQKYISIKCYMVNGAVRNFNKIIKTFETITQLRKRYISYVHHISYIKTQCNLYLYAK